MPRPVLEMVLSEDSKTERFETTEDISTAVQNIQGYAIIQNKLGIWGIIIIYIIYYIYIYIYIMNRLYTGVQDTTFPTSFGFEAFFKAYWSVCLCYKRDVKYIN